LGLQAILSLATDTDRHHLELRLDGPGGHELLDVHFGADAPAQVTYRPAVSPAARAAMPLAAIPDLTIRHLVGPDAVTHLDGDPEVTRRFTAVLLSALEAVEPPG